MSVCMTVGEFVDCICGWACVWLLESF